MVLLRQDYERVLLRFEEANLRVFIEFLKGMPHFRHWSKNALSRLTYYLPRQIFLRNQVVFKEGDPCSYVYIVYKGEFQISKRVAPAFMKETKLSSYIGPIKEKSDMNGRIEKHMIKPAAFFP